MQTYDIFLIKPTRYDDEGYPVQWWRSVLPSNSLACVAALVDDARLRKVAGEDVAIVSHVIDECNMEVSPQAILARGRTPGARLLVMLVGVQTNQFPRAMDIARPLRAEGIPVCIGGFHVSGCLSMLGADAPELTLVHELGVSMFAGEAEERRIDQVLQDGFNNALKPIYNHLADMPKLGGEPVPLLGAEVVERTMERWSSFDLGRGCPFECSFCTIINVQGRKSRFRDADDLERIVRENHAIGVHRFFVTDDNLLRNRNWEAYADRLIQLQETDGIYLRLVIQVDTMAHRTPRFIEKMYRAGAHIVFIGLENINPDNLEGAKKRQNRIEEYREMIMAWKIHGVIVTCGYILGFPKDTKESILKDIDIIKRELPIDMLYFNFLTPLPGSEDHKLLRAAGGWMDPDLNKYDLNHRVSHHPIMSDQEWEDAFWAAHRRFYTHEHMARIFNRMMQMKTNQPFSTLKSLLVYSEGPRLEGTAFSEYGVIRIVRRKQRRSGLPIESPLIFYPRMTLRVIHKLIQYALTYARLRISLAQARVRYRAGRPYMDAAIAPTTGGPEDRLVVETAARSTAVARRRQEIRQKIQAEATAAELTGDFNTLTT